jgi:hypothetical protein
MIPLSAEVFDRTQHRRALPPVSYGVVAGGLNLYRGVWGVLQDMRFPP